MKTVIDFSPVFAPLAQTLDFSLLNGFEIKKLFAVINITRNTIIYAVGTPAYGYSSFGSGVLTLLFDTTTHNAVDHLMVIYEISSNEAIKIDDASSTISYIGYAEVGASTASGVWKICKITSSGTITSVEWADSNKLYDNIWDNRAVLTYG